VLNYILVFVITQYTQSFYDHYKGQLADFVGSKMLLAKYPCWSTSSCNQWKHQL